jgi:hypothetical protein
MRTLLNGGKAAPFRPQDDANAIIAFLDCGDPRPDLDLVWCQPDRTELTDCRR